MHQAGFNQKRKQHFIKNAREIFERLRENGQLKPENLFEVPVKYLSPVPEQD